ncbi:MAG: metallophosphoesterase [Kiritimatiellae bacterium]|nr:metallophosphoesterase [Kiritimatiellia bacterium]
MNRISRRSFLIGGTAAFGAFCGSRFAIAAPSFKAGETPRLRFGVVSDIHILRVGADEKMESFGNNLTFRHTLEWFRSQGVDAVVIAGDMADKGMDANLMAVSEAWYSVFPEDKYPDGRPVAKFFVTGNHDWEGYNYGKAAKKRYPDAAERVKHVLQKDMAGWWERAFHEPYSPIYSKEIKGYTFIGSHWDTSSPSGGKVYAFGRIEDFMAKNAKKINPALPFFYVQHPHPKDTCYGPWAWGHDKGIVTKTLSAYPNAVAFSGHSHYSLTDERSIWQGAFTSVGTSSLRYTGLPTRERVPDGFENTGATGPDAWRVDAMKGLRTFHSGDCRQGMLWSVYDDCIVVRRREFLSNLDIGEDWVMPLPAAEPKPFAFAARAKKFRAPEFPEGAEIALSVLKAKNRGGKSPDGKETIPSERKPSFKLVVPAVVKDDKARLFTMEFVAEADGVKKTKLVMPDGFNHALAHAKTSMPTTCYFRCGDFGKGDVRFTVTPLNCFGARGRPLVKTFTGKRA